MAKRPAGIKAGFFVRRIFICAEICSVQLREEPDNRTKKLRHERIIAEINCNEADFEIKYYNIIFT